MRDRTKGLLAMVGAATIWGLAPLFYKALTHVPAIDVLSHRMVWSFVLFALMLAAQGQLRDLFTTLTNWRSLALISGASLMIATNWLVFIWAVQVGRTTEASLGYYIYPLVAVAIGRLVFAEELSKRQWVAVGLAGFAVTLLTTGTGTPPWIAMFLAVTFGIYGLIKKRLAIGPVLSVSVEIMLILPFACLVLLRTYLEGGNALGGDVQTGFLLILSGPITAAPLILFGYAARRLTMSSIGLLQYINPTLQFICAVVIFAEPFGLWHMVAFALIWVSLAVYSLSILRQENDTRSASSSTATSSTTS